MIAHRLIQQENGDLAVTVPEAVDQAFTEPISLEMTPLNGAWQLGADEAAVSSPNGYACMLMNRVPECCKLEMTVRFDETPREFGVALQVDQDFAMGYYLLFEPRRGRVQYKTGLRMYEDGGKMFPYEVEQERPFHWEAGRDYRVRIFVQGSILLLYVDDRIALGTRMLDRSGRQFGLFVSEGSAAFRRIRLQE